MPNMYPDPRMGPVVRPERPQAAPMAPPSGELEDLRAEVQRLRAENEALRRAAGNNPQEPRESLIGLPQDFVQFKQGQASARERSADPDYAGYQKMLARRPKYRGPGVTALPAAPSFEQYKAEQEQLRRMMADPDYRAYSQRQAGQAAFDAAVRRREMEKMLGRALTGLSGRATPVAPPAST